MSKLWMGFGLAAVLGLTVLPGAASAAGDAAKGKVGFEQNCATCHGMGGKGDGPTGAALASQGIHPRDFTKAEFKYDTDKDGKSGTDADLANVIKNGAAAYGGNALMASWAHLGDATIADLIAHIRTFHP